MKNTLFVFIFLSSISSFTNAQFRVTQPQGNFYDLKTAMNAYYDSLFTIYGDTLFSGEGSEYSEYQKFLEFWGPRIYPHGDFNKYAQALAAYYNNPPTTFANSDPWHELGPFHEPTTTVGTEGIGPIDFLTFYNQNSNIMLAGSHAGGLFFSSDGGNSWSNAGSDLQFDRSGCGSAVFQPNDPQTWYTSSSGVGETGGTDILYTRGIYRTTDAGAHWTRIADYTNIGGAAGAATTIYKLLIDPSDPNGLLYATTSNGLFVCHNALNSPSWSLISSICSSSLCSAYDLELKPLDNQTIFASVADEQVINWTRYYTNWRIMMSSDGGVSWSPLPNLPLTTSVKQSNSWITMEVSHANPERLYCQLFAGGNSTQISIYYFDLNSQTWVFIGNSNFQAGYGPYGVGNAFSVNQFDGNEVYVGAGFWSTKFNIGNPTTSASMISSHVDVNDIVALPFNSINSPNEVWLANHGGLNKSNDHGQHWSTMNIGLGVTEVHRFATSFTDPNTILMGVYHDGTMISTTPYSDNNWDPGWSIHFGGDGLRPLIDNTDPKYMFASYQSEGWGTSSNNGSNFSGLSSVSTSGCSFSAGPDWYSEGTLNKVDPSIFYRISRCSGKDYVYRSFNRGTTYSIITPDFTTINGNYVIWRAYTPYNAKDVLCIHVIKDDGTHHLFRTKISTDPNTSNVINSWVELPLPVDKWISGINFDFDNPDIIYMAFASTFINANQTQGADMVFKMNYSNPANMVYNTCSSGCTNLTLNLPNSGMGNDGIALERGSDGGLYVGTDVGVFYTNNKLIADGTEWQKFGSLLPNVICFGLEITYPINKLRVGLFGRGVWEHALACPPDNDLTLGQTGNIPTDFYEAENNITITSVPTQATTSSLTARAGNVIDVVIGGLDKPGTAIILAPSTHLFIHGCDHIGNSFRKASPNNSSNDNTETTNRPITQSDNFKFTYYPNPFMDHLHIDFLLDKSSPVLVSVYSPQGQLIETLANGTYEAGEHTLVFDNSSLKPGLYFIRLDMGDKHYAKAVIKSTE